MLKLICLEWKKQILWNYVRNAVIVTTILLGVLMLISSDSSTGKLVAQTGKSEIHSLVEMFLNMAYLVFTGAMLSTFVISEYENKLIHLMFSYPIKRCKIMVSKVLAACLFNGIALLSSKFLVFAVLIATRSTENLGIQLGEVSFWAGAILGAVASVCCGCISLLVGMKLRSSRAALIASFVLMLAILGITQGNVLPYTTVLGAAAYVAQVLLAIAAIVLATCGIETEDVN